MDSHSCSTDNHFKIKFIPSLLQARRATAHLQTGAGKTYTMGSGNIAGKPDEEIGIIPRVMQDVFRRLQAAGAGGHSIVIRASYIEIYNDEVRDLLFPGAQGRPIAIRERGDGTIVLAGVREAEVASLEEMLRLLEEGSLCRTVAGTLMNTHSSRSHSIFTIAVERRRAAETVAAKLHLVDLAG